MTNFNLETATVEQLDAFATQCRLSANEKTVLLALHSVGMFLNERNTYYVQSNLKDVISFASPRLRAMKASAKDHLLYVGQLTLLQQKAELRNHFAAFCKGVRALK